MYLSPLPGEPIVQLGWFNHQLRYHFWICVRFLPTQFTCWSGWSIVDIAHGPSGWIGGACQRGALGMSFRPLECSRNPWPSLKPTVRPWKSPSFVENYHQNVVHVPWLCEFTGVYRFPTHIKKNIWLTTTQSSQGRLEVLEINFPTFNQWIPAIGSH